MESFSTWHNTVAGAKQSNGFGWTRGWRSTRRCMRHIENLGNMAKQGPFIYKGRGNIPGDLLRASVR